MKKILSATCAMMLASAGMMANAQQLPNVGFENWKETCGSSLNTSNNQVLARPGIEPSGWNGGNVNQFGVAKNDALCTQGIEENNKYLILTNKKVGLGSLTATAPGFVSLSTPWIFASFSMMSEAALKLGDGGTYGGVAFEYKPDAISLKYKKTAVDSEVSRVIAYIWSGEFVSQVPKNIKDNGNIFSHDYVISEWTTLTDVDRAIIGRESSDKVVEKGTLIAKVDYEITEDKSNWTSLEIPFTYEENTSMIKPEKMNVIISSGNYWSRSGLNENSMLDVDDVRFVYYSRLASISLNEEAITLEEGKYDYTVDKVLDFSEDKVVPTVMGKNAKAEVSIDFKRALVTVTVSNVGADSDGKSSHTYTFQYQKPVVEEYTGYLNVEMGGSLIEENATSTIEILDHQNDYCTFLLPNLTIGGTLPLGDIRIFNVVITSVEGGNSYAGTVDDMILHNDMLGDIHAKVVLNGTIIRSDVKMDVDVIWYQDYPTNEVETPIKVSFTSAKLSGVESVAGDGVKVYAAAGCVVVEGAEGVAQVYTVDGKQVAAEAVNGKTEIALANGLYIVRVGNKVQKVVVK